MIMGVVMVSIAIACQGGSSHTAFTAGVLKRILQEDGEKYDIIALSGTSGGGICALLAWYGLLTDGRDYAVNLIESFWKELSARTPGDMVFNEFLKTLPSKPIKKGTFGNVLFK